MNTFPPVYEGKPPATDSFPSRRDSFSYFFFWSAWTFCCTFCCSFRWFETAKRLCDVTMMESNQTYHLLPYCWIFCQLNWDIYHQRNMQMILHEFPKYLLGTLITLYRVKQSYAHSMRKTFPEIILQLNTFTAMCHCWQLSFATKLTLNLNVSKCFCKLLVEFVSISYYSISKNIRTACSNSDNYLKSTNGDPRGRCFNIEMSV